MRPNVNIYYLITLLVVFSSCDFIAHNSEAEPPCAYCPFDFRATDYAADWSPDGSTIAYVHSDSALGKSGIYLVNPDGSDIRQWYDRGATPRWSPDGEWITFEQGGQIFKRTVEGDSLVQLTFEGRNFFPAWSPDGKWIAYDRSLEDETGPAGIWGMNVDGNEKESLFGGGLPTWNPNGLSILAVIGTSATSVWKRFKIYTIHNGSTEIFNAVVDADNLYPEYSSDGQKIVFTSQHVGEKPQIWVMDKDGSNLKQLTHTAGYMGSWSPDGNWIVYTDTRAVSGRLWLMRSDGSEKRQLTFD